MIAYKTVVSSICKKVRHKMAPAIPQRTLGFMLMLAMRENIGLCIVSVALSR